MQEVTQLTQVTLLTNRIGNSTKHKPSNLKQVMQKMEVTNFRNFCLKNSGISGLGGNGISGNPEIGISGIAITNWLNTAYTLTEFDDCSFSQSRDMIGAPQI